jgi:hypothetical protein
MVVLAASPAVAAPLPYADPSVQGTIGLCDPSGHLVTRGSIDDKPFIWRAVSSVPAPPPFNGPSRKATLLAYQPRASTPPDQWNGDSLTATSTYSNPNAPMAQATALDFTLKDFLSEYPPQVSGYVQLRVYFAAGGVGTTSARYPALDLHIDGHTWTATHAAPVSCTNGSAESTETVPGARTAAFPPRHSVPSVGAGPSLGSAAASHAASASAAQSRASEYPTLAGAGTTASSVSAVAPAADGHGQDGSILPVVFGAALALAALLGGVGFWAFRRRTGP